MSVLYLNDCILCVPNIMGLGILFKNCTSSNLASLLDTASQFALFSVFGLKDEKLIKPNLHEETYKLYSGDCWIFLPNVIKIDPYNFSHTISQFMIFSETQCILFYCCRNKTNAGRTHSIDSNSSMYSMKQGTPTLKRQRCLVQLTVRSHHIFH